MMYVLNINEPPKRAMAMGGILRWKDGRNMPDVHATLFEYGQNPVYMRLNLGTGTPETYRFMGSKGILDIGGDQIVFTPQSGRDESPSWYSSGFPHAMKQEYVNKWHADHDLEPGREPLAESIVFKSDQFDDTRPHLWNFFRAVKSRKPVTEDVVFGHHAALACHMSNESYFRKTAVYWDESTKTIKS
jgi:hypothetical protein